MRDFMQRTGDAIARDAEAHAPVGHPLSQGGARSIHAETNLTPKGWRVKISWDRRHYYMRFPETGTKYQHARPFLRPALERARV
jgi:HK97 gp10 family phage protein